MPLKSRFHTFSSHSIHLKNKKAWSQKLDVLCKNDQAVINLSLSRSFPNMLRVDSYFVIFISIVFQFLSMPRSELTAPAIVPLKIFTTNSLRAISLPSTNSLASNPYHLSNTIADEKVKAFL